MRKGKNTGQNCFVFLVPGNFVPSHGASDFMYVLTVGIQNDCKCKNRFTEKTKYVCSLENTEDKLWVNRSVFDCVWYCFVFFSYAVS